MKLRGVGSSGRGSGVGRERFWIEINKGENVMEEVMEGMTWR